MSALRTLIISCGLVAVTASTGSAHADRIRELDRQAARLERQTVEMVRYLRWEVGDCPRLGVLLQQADGLFCLAQEVQRELLFFEGDPRSIEQLERKLARFQQQTVSMCATLDELRHRRPAGFGVGLHAGGATVHPRPGRGWSIYFGSPQRPHHTTYRSIGFGPAQPVANSGRIHALHHRVEQLGRSAERLQRELCRI